MAKQFHYRSPRQRRERAREAREKMAKLLPKSDEIQRSSNPRGIQSPDMTNPKKFTSDIIIELLKDKERS